MEAKEEHWVEKLFSPHFSAQDFLEQPHKPEASTSENQARERAKRVEEIYNTAVKKFQEEKKLKSKRFHSSLIVSDCEPKLKEESQRHLIAKKQERNNACCGDANVSLSGEEFCKDIEDCCIWNKRELATLRQEMNRKHCEGFSQRMQLSAMKLELADFKVRYKKAEEDLDNMERKLAKSRRETKCKAVLLEQTQKDILKKNLELQVLKEELEEKSSNVNNVNRDLLNAKKEIQELGQRNQDLQQELKTLKQDHELPSITTTEKAKLQFELEIKKLHREIETCERELNAEKLQHARDLKALEVLRKHFASLPLSKLPNSFQIKYLDS
uniref:Coiled-coil domain-containing protein 160 n=1 Tax=Geotrypetes seraphini TaxID=260995 RepID=A0A6P8R3H6_GEOSA|nr:coiled-coil domain-containing protein 160 [Geotrypetes seraphini]XP_033802621.1 coiled-coil domain-containing protein 160 [Geotrypetes seraphini]XP_033802622.1 coiled-coil domain-containing protein 160 [Geotrypetes seraphini]XP_033802623.1 coiled-coil domain-containing protein 160 [Geotrypetes seraphini]XP_033802624.1 coiled-coil domain-containing protein 160 [Geotrypetes seraphini]XP_033802625.1 coiled-coil domain-containing protein 160 [Geotrypetes seraphini]